MITEAEYRGRLERLRREAETSGFDALVIFSTTMHPGQLLYLSGFAPFNGSAVSAVTRTSCHLLTDAKWELDRARSETWLDDDQIAYTVDYATALDRILGSCRNIGIAGMELFPLGIYQSLCTASGARTFNDATSVLDHIRQTKSPAEIDMLRKASWLTDVGHRSFSDAVRPGISEIELALAVESSMKLAGSGRLSFPTVLGSGSRAAALAPAPTKRVIRDGDIVLLDCGATYAGYCGDASRTAIVGETPEPQRRLVETVLHLYGQCMPLLRPGMGSRQIHETTRRLAAEEGYEYVYATGHSIGCENHEPPFLDDTSADVPLEENMVVAVEPGLYVDEVGGARIESTILITIDGAQELNRSPLRLWN